jgi:uncharacterized circularly permuted ATP-grasp superfamily protein
VVVRRKPALDYTLAHLDELVIVPAFSSMRMQPVFGHTVTGTARRRLIESLQLQPHAYAAQEWVRLSQAPVMSRSGDYRLMNRTISLRVFAVADGTGGYQVMPGGLTRVAPRQRRDVVSMQQGGTSKDVWVLREEERPDRPWAMSAMVQKTSRSSGARWMCPRTRARTCSGWGVIPNA